MDIAHELFIVELLIHVGTQDMGIDEEQYDEVGYVEDNHEFEDGVALLQYR